MFKLGRHRFPIFHNQSSVMQDIQQFVFQLCHLFLAA
ncbi:Uncharacterised protein [Vibrio cholerae]|nr:Uncharacterised protein [Vibrio cholerae]